jgi:hypothetical protein
VKHIRCLTEDVPPPPVVFDRRHAPDRRDRWRGGRRDSDWHNRPDGVWGRMAIQPSWWARQLSSLNLW